MTIDPSLTEESPPEPEAEPKVPDGPAYAEGLRSGDPLFLLAQRIFRSELEALNANLRPRRELPLPQEIHQSRIALRRLRVALSVFRDFMPAPIERFRVEFRWLAQALGEMRDLDVYEETLQGADGAGPLPAVVKRSIARLRKDASSRLVSLLGSKRFAELQRSFAEFAGSDLPPGVQRRWRSLRIRDAIEGDLRKSLKRVLKAGRKIDVESPPEELHELRIRAKRLRYEAEFYSGFADGLDVLARGAKRIQDLLGAQRDALAAIERLRALTRAVKGDAKARAAIAPLIRAQTERAGELGRRYPAAWRKFEKTAAKAKPGR
jgi:CHAD domain-containing protein